MAADFIEERLLLSGHSYEPYVHPRCRCGRPARYLGVQRGRHDVADVASCAIIGGSAVLLSVVDTLLGGTDA
jgi:hypothetical protein